MRGGSLNGPPEGPVLNIDKHYSNIRSYQLRRILRKLPNLSAVVLDQPTAHFETLNLWALVAIVC